MLESQTLSVTVGRQWKDVYEAIWRPENFPQWASGLSDLPRGAIGTVRIRFTEHNPFGVMDHYVDTGKGSVVYVPMRVIANGEGAEVLLTLFRQPDMSDQQFTADAEWVKRDLRALKSLLE